MFKKVIVALILALTANVAAAGTTITSSTTGGLNVDGMVNSFVQATTLSHQFEDRSSLSITSSHFENLDFSSNWNIKNGFSVSYKTTIGKTGVSFKHDSLRDTTKVSFRAQHGLSYSFTDSKRGQKLNVTKTFTLN